MLFLTLGLLPVFLSLIFFGIPRVMGENKVFQVLKSINDVRNVAGNRAIVTDVYTQYLGKFGSVDYWSGWRWERISVPQGSKIKKATIDIYSAGLGSGDVAEIIFLGEASGNARVFDIGSQKPELKLKTDASVVHKFDVSLWSQKQGFGVEDIDVTSIIQEIIDRDDWQSGNSIVLVAHDNGSANDNFISFSTYDRGGGRGAKLLIEYDEKTQSQEANINTNYSKTMAWIYPGDPACRTGEEYTDGRVVDFLKPEYFTVDYNGRLRLITTADGCNGYSFENIADLQKNSKYQFATVSSGPSNMISMVSDIEKQEKAISQLLDFVLRNNFSGIEIDFEGYGVWSSNNYEDYKKFIGKLGSALHAENKKLMIDGPPISNDREQGYYVWRYEDFIELPVDYIVVMAYDYMYDWGAGAPIAPNEWLSNIINWVKVKVNNLDKIVIGLPSYGYHGLTGKYRVSIDTKKQSEKFPGFETAKRDADSYEMTWENNGTTYIYQDSEGLSKKRKLIESMGIKYISVFHLGGNDWFME